MNALLRGVWTNGATRSDARGFTPGSRVSPLRGYGKALLPPDSGSIPKRGGTHQPGVEPLAQLRGIL